MNAKTRKLIRRAVRSLPKELRKTTNLHDVEAARAELSADGRGRRNQKLHHFPASAIAELAEEGRLLRTARKAAA